jgi:hypothetical protein
MADFVTVLRDLGFVRDDGEAAAAPPRVRYQRLGALAFSPPLWACYLGIIVAAALAMARYPQLRPAPGNVFFVRSLVIVQIGVFASQLPALAWHEWFHVLAGRRLGLPTRLTVGRRLFFTVFETHLNGLLGVPRSRRYLPFLAGLLADLVLFSGLTLAAAADRPAALSWPGRLALTVGYVTLLRMAWQLCAFLRTDSYYVLTTALGCTDLAGAAAAFLRSRLSPRERPGPRDRLALRDRFSLRGRLSLRGGRPWPAPPGTEFSPRDRALAPWFALLTVAGVTSLFVLAGIAVLPAVIELVTRWGPGFSRGTVTSARFWDSAGSVALTLVQIGLLPLIVGRRARSRRPATSPTIGALQ